MIASNVDRFAIKEEEWKTGFAQVVGLELVDVSCLVVDVAAEAAVGVGVGAADVGGVAAVAAVAAAAAAGMVSSNVGAHGGLTCGGNLACHYPSSHFGVGGLRRGVRLGAPDHMLLKCVAATLEGELISRT